MKQKDLATAVVVSISTLVMVLFGIGVYNHVTTQKNNDLEQQFEIPTTQYNKLFSVDRPEILAVYTFKYKTREYLISSRGGIVEVK